MKTWRVSAKVEDDDLRRRVKYLAIDMHCTLGTLVIAGLKTLVALQDSHLTEEMVEAQNK